MTVHGADFGIFDRIELRYEQDSKRILLPQWIGFLREIHDTKNQEP